MVQGIKDNAKKVMSEALAFRRTSLKNNGEGGFAERVKAYGSIKHAAGGEGISKGRLAAQSARISSYARSRLYPKLITKVQALRLATYAPIIQHASRTFGVPVELICAVILQESGGNPKAVSHCGARGLMQLMPATARRLGVSNPHDPFQNIMGGTKYLRELLNRFGGNIALAIAGYNAGEGNVEKYGMRIPPFAETRAYVPNVLKYADTIWRLLRGGKGAQLASRGATAPLNDQSYFRPILNFSRRA